MWVKAIKGFATVLGQGITIPVWIVLAVGVWLYFDRASAVRQAVDRAVTHLVHSAELEAAKAREEALRMIIADQRRKADADREALARYARLLEAAENEKEGLADELADLAAQPLDQCVVDRVLLDRLRNGR